MGSPQGTFLEVTDYCSKRQVKNLKVPFPLFLQLLKISTAWKFYLPLIQLEITLGTFQLLQIQEDIRRQFKMDGSGPENDVESHIRLNKETLMSSIWKLNVADIEVTLVHVCQMVSFCVS